MSELQQVLTAIQQLADMVVALEQRIMAFESLTVRFVLETERALSDESDTETEDPLAPPYNLRVRR
jgi:hypothetical protein